jgi:sulfate adenylyltransferase subunit 2
MKQNSINHLQEIEAEAIFVIREVVAQFQNPVLLFSGGKDSIVMFHLARKAFYPSNVPFPLMHIDTGHNFPETIEFRDWLSKEFGARIIVASVQQTIDKGRAMEEKGINASRNRIQTITLLDAIEEYKFDCAMGGGRRDEEKSRAKERFFSHRDAFGQWNPKNQRPELWNIFNGRKNPGEHFRVFPLSNWTEMDVWQYIYHEQIKVPNLYFAHIREVFTRDNVLYAKTPYMQLKDNEKVISKTVRFRTVGDATCTGALESSASTVDEIIIELQSILTTERGSRADDRRGESAMEDRKVEGYF